MSENEFTAEVDKLDKIHKICRILRHEADSEIGISNYYLNLIKKDDSLSLKSKESLDFIERSVEYREINLQRLLVFLDIYQIISQPFTVAGLFEKIEQIIKPRVPSKISLEFKFVEKLNDYKLSLNKHLLLWVIWEIISNSTKAIGLKEGNIFISTELSCDYIEILIKDSGNGISSVVLADLFIKELPSPSALGLGLYLSNKVIDSFGGSIKVIETSEYGTTFSIRLPIESVKGNQ